MKTRMYGETGILECKTSSFETVKFEFPTSSLVNWYPLDTRYEYRYNPATGMLYLVPLERTQGEWDYGIKSSDNRVYSEVASFPVEEWECKEVKEANLKELERARKLNIVCHDEKFTKAQVQKNMDVTLKDIEKLVRRKIERQMIDSITREQYETYRKMREEKKDIFMLKYAEEDDLTLLRFYGKMRVMMNLMRQIVGM